MKTAAEKRLAAERQVNISKIVFFTATAFILAEAAFAGMTNTDFWSAFDVDLSDPIAKTWNTYALITAVVVANAAVWNINRLYKPLHGIWGAKTYEEMETAKQT